MTYRVFDTGPTYYNADLHIEEMCLVSDKLLSKVTPRFVQMLRVR